MDIEVRLLLDRLFDHIGTIDYYSLLGVARDADLETIRQAFYARADLMHPDRYYNLRDTDLREKLYVVYKRVAEAYRVLSASDVRREYDEQLRAGRVRYRRDTLKDLPKEPEMTIRNLRARKLYMDARTALAEGHVQAGRLALRMADALEPGNAAIRDALDEAERMTMREKR